MLLKMSPGKWRPFCLDRPQCVIKENLQLCVSLKMNHSLLKREHHNSGRKNDDLNANKWSLFKLALPSSTQKHTVVINDWRESCIADQWGQSVGKLRLQPLLFRQACFMLDSRQIFRYPWQMYYHRQISCPLGILFMLESDKKVTVLCWI